MANLGAETGGANNVRQVTDGQPSGWSFGQSTADLISFYNSTPVAQQASSVDLITQLVTLGLIASGTTIQARGAPVVLTAAATTTPAANGGRTNVISNAAGFAIRMPAATGSGTTYDFIVATTVTTGTQTIVTAGTDTFAGTALQVSGASTACFNTASATTVSFTGTTKGGFVGDKCTFVDVSTGVWNVQVVGKVSGIAASPFS